MASTSGVGGGGRDEAPSTPGMAAATLSTPMAGTLSTPGMAGRIRQRESTTPTGVSPQQQVPRLGPSPDGGVGAAASTSRASGAPPSPIVFNMAAASGAGGAVPPQPDAAEGDNYLVYQPAKNALTDTLKQDLCGDPKADPDRREKIIAGLENIIPRVVVLDDAADTVLGIVGDVTEEFQTPTTLEDVNFVVAARAPGDRPADAAVPMRPKNDKDDKGFAKVKLKFEDGDQAYDAPVTEAEYEDNERRLRKFLDDSKPDSRTGNDVVAKEENGVSLASLPLDRERELMAKNGDELPPRMRVLALSGTLNREFDVIKEGREAKGKQQERTKRHGLQANANVRARIRSCTEETKALPLEICLLATPGANVSDAADGTVMTVQLPAIVRWPIDNGIDNLSVKPRGAFLFPMRTEKKDVSRNANNLAGGTGAGGGRGETRVSASNAERRLSMNKELFSAEKGKHLHQACGASFHEDFPNVAAATALKMNALTRTAKDGITEESTRRQWPHNEIFAGKLRMQPPPCVLNVIIRIYGDNGQGLIAARGELAARGDALHDRLYAKYLGNGVKRRVFAAKLLLHSLRYADYENIKKDRTRRVLPIFTDHSITDFWEDAFGGIAILMREANARPGTFHDERVALVEGSMEDVRKAKAHISVKVLSRVLSCLSPYQDTNKERGSLTKIAGVEVTHGLRVRNSLGMSLKRVAKMGYVADLADYRKASELACESLVRSAEHILRLKPPKKGLFKQLLGHGTSLRDRKDGRTTFANIFKTMKDDNKDGKFVHFVVLRLSAEDSIESETRFGFGVQLDMWKAQYMTDRSDEVYGSRKDHHIVWLVSAGRSRLATHPLDAPVAIFEEDPTSEWRLPDLTTMTTATVRTAIGVAIGAKGERAGRPVVMSAMYSDRVSLEEFTDAARDVRVVGFDAFDLRPLIDFFPEIMLGQERWKRRMIHVERGYGGNALVVHRLGCALAAPCDLNVLRLAGFEAANQESSRPEPEKTSMYMKRVADFTARPLKVFEDVIVPRWFEAVDSNGDGRAASPGPSAFKDQTKVNYRVDTKNLTSALRHSGLEQMWRSQHQMLRWAGGLGLTKVYLRPFPATIDLKSKESARANSLDSPFYKAKRLWLPSDKTWSDNEAVPDSTKEAKLEDIKNANFFASTSRAANPGILEHAHDKPTFFCLVDVAIAVKEKMLDDVWVRPDNQTPSDEWGFARRTNLRNPYVYAVLRASRDGGHLPHRLLLGPLISLGIRGAKADADASASTSEGA